MNGKWNRSVLPWRLEGDSMSNLRNILPFQSCSLSFLALPDTWVHAQLPDKCTHSPNDLIGGWQCAKYCARENQLFVGKPALGSDFRMQPPPFQSWDVFVSMTFPLPPHIPLRSFIGQCSEDLYRSHEKESLTKSLPQVENLAHQYVVWSSWVSMKATCSILWQL